MNIIEWFTKNCDAGDAMVYGLIGFLIWFILWKLLIGKLFEKLKLYSLLELGAFGVFGLLIFLSFIVVLIIASIQAIIEFGAKLAFPFLLFWGGFIALSIFFVKKLNQ